MINHFDTNEHGIKQRISERVSIWFPKEGPAKVLTRIAGDDPDFIDNVSKAVRLVGLYNGDEVQA